MVMNLVDDNWPNLWSHIGPSQRIGGLGCKIVFPGAQSIASERHTAFARTETKAVGISREVPCRIRAKQIHVVPFCSQREAVALAWRRIELRLIKGDKSARTNVAAIRDAKLFRR